MTAGIRTAAVRNLARWPESETETPAHPDPAAAFDHEVAMLRERLRIKSEWMDANLPILEARRPE